MYDESEDSEDNIINEDLSKFHELGLLPDSSKPSHKKKTNPDDPEYPPLSVKFTNRLSENFTNEYQEEINHKDDSKTKKNPTAENFNRSVDDIYVLRLFAKKDPDSPLESKNKKFFERLLNPMEYGTVRGGVFALSSICLEAGAMVLGIRCAQFGLVNFLIIIILGGLLAYWCLVMMIKAGKNIEEQTYSKVVKTILGKKVGIFMDTIITIDLFGELISFQVIIYQTLGAVVYDIMKMTGSLDVTKYKSFVEYKKKRWQEAAYLKFPIMFGLAALVYPLCLLKDISKMRIPSLIGVLALIYSMLVVIFESIFYMINVNKDKVGEMNWIDITKSFDVPDGIPFFGGIATVFYLYSCHAGAYPVYKTLENRTERKIKKIFFRSILLDIIAYILIATASFITAPIDSPDLILYRENLPGFDPDYFMLVAKIGLIFNTFFSTPANYEVFRLSFFELIWGNSHITDKKNIIVTAIVLISVTAIGAVYDRILEYFELIGGFCTVIYCILIPGLIYAKNSDIPKTKLKKYGIIITMFFLVLIGYTSGILTLLYEMINIDGGPEDDM